MDVFLVRQTSHQHDVVFSAYWHTEPDTAHGLFDYVPQDSVYGEATREEIAANRARHTVQTKDGLVLEGDEVFSVRFTPVDYVVDPNDPERDNRCEITIIDDDLVVESIEMVSAPRVDDTYGLGETIEFAADFAHEVEVRGHVVMGLWVGGNWRGATYRRGSGSDRLIFGYEVQPEDTDGDGISVHDGYVEDSGTRHGIGGSGVIIEPNSGGQAAPWYNGINDQPGHRVNGSRAPRAITLCRVNPANGDTYRAGETIFVDVVFSAPVRALNTPLVSLWFDGTGESLWRGATYHGGSGTDTLRFSYDVQPGDTDTDGLLVGAKEAQGLGEGKVKALNHDVNAIHTYNEWRPGHRVNGVIQVTGVSVVSSPASGDTYRYGENIEVDVTFSVPVTASDNPMVSLWFDGTETSLWRGAEYQSGSGTRTLRFSYEVAPEDRDTDGILIGAIDGQGLGEGKSRPWTTVGTRTMPTGPSSLRGTGSTANPTSRTWKSPPVPPWTTESTAKARSSRPM